MSSEDVSSSSAYAPYAGRMTRRSASEIDVRGEIHDRYKPSVDAMYGGRKLADARELVETVRRWHNAVDILSSAEEWGDIGLEGPIKVHRRGVTGRVDVFSRVVLGKRQRFEELLQSVSPIPGFESACADEGVGLDAGFKLNAALILGNRRLRGAPDAGAADPPLILSTQKSAVLLATLEKGDRRFQKDVLSGGGCADLTDLYANSDPQAPLVVLHIGKGTEFTASDKIEAIKAAHTYGRNVNFHHLAPDMDDNTEHLQKYLPDAILRGIDLIRTYRYALGAPVIVHCRQGISRSVAVVVGWLLEEFATGGDFTLSEIRSFVALRRRPYLIVPEERAEARKRMSDVYKLREVTPARRLLLEKHRSTGGDFLPYIYYSDTSGNTKVATGTYIAYKTISERSGVQISRSLGARGNAVPVQDDVVHVSQGRTVALVERSPKRALASRDDADEDREAKRPRRRSGCRMCSRSIYVDAEHEDERAIYVCSEECKSAAVAKFSAE